MENRMTQEQAFLWKRLQEFNIDDTGSKLKFSDRLARENGWSKGFAQRAIEEYKRFLFLCCVQPHGATPSDQVDQVWHLHMIYTRSYWNDLCANVLQRELHHGPTKGGKNEGDRFDRMYTNTISEYMNFFGEWPPLDIWPSNEQRFSDIDFQRVNIRRNWVIPKPSAIFQRIAAMMSVCLVALFGIQASGLDGGTIGVIAIVIVAAIVVLAIVRPFKKKDYGGYTVNSSYTPLSSSIHRTISSSSTKKKKDGGSGCTTDTSSAWIAGSSGCSSPSDSGGHSDGGSSGCSGCGGGCGGGCS